MKALHFEKLLWPGAAAMVTIMNIQPAHAALTYNIYESGGNVIVETNGRLDLTGGIVKDLFNCDNGKISSSFGLVCTGSDITKYLYRTSGPLNFNGAVEISPATSTSGLSTAVVGYDRGFAIDLDYISGDTIVSSAVFSGQTLAGLGFTTTGLIGTWTLEGSNDTINVVIGAPVADAPGPLPLLGAGVAFGWSRRLRRRIALGACKQPKA